MPSRGSTGRPKVDRSTSPLPRKPAPSPVQELKPLFSEPVVSNTAVSNGEKESDFRFEAIQCLRQSSIIKRRKDLPERGNWSSKVRRRPMHDILTGHVTSNSTISIFFSFKDRIHFIRRGTGHRFGESVAISVSLL